MNAIKFKQWLVQIHTVVCMILRDIGSGVKSILKQNLSKSIVTDGKTTRSKVKSID